MMTLSWRNCKYQFTMWSAVETTRNCGHLEMVPWEQESSTFFFFCLHQDRKKIFLYWDSVHEKTSIRLRLRVILHDEKPVLLTNVKGIGNRKGEGLFQTEGDWWCLTTKDKIRFRFDPAPGRKRHWLMPGQIQMGFIGWMIVSH